MIWDTFLPSGEPAHNIAWTYFLNNSPYSPFHLTHLRQPTPSDLPSDADASLFTFTDAFEDLLAVSASQPPLPIDSRVSLRTLLRQVFPSGETPSFWLQRLNSSDLLAPNSRHFLVPDEWDTHTFGSRRLEGQSPLDHVEAFRREFEQAAKGLAPSEDDVKKAGEAIQDLTEVWSSVFGSGAKSFGTFVDLIKDGSSGFQTEFNVNTSSKGSMEVEMPLGNGKKKTVESKDQYIDFMGMLHTKHTTKIVDENGKVLSSQSQWSVTNNYDQEKYKDLLEKKNSDSKPKDW